MYVFRRADLIRDGHTQQNLRRQVRQSEIDHVRRGVYAPADDLDPAERELRRIVATAGEAQRGTLVSHFSAAHVWGLPIPQQHLKHVWLLRPGAPTSRTAGLVRLHHARLHPDDVACMSGLDMTSLARTAVDITCRLDHPGALAVVDAALRAGLEPDRLRAALARGRGMTGIGRARWAADVADVRAESAGESRSRALIQLAGLPSPQLQHEIRDADGLIGRVDFWWERHGLVGEFDGKIKYSRDLAPDGDPTEALFREKLREDRIRALGLNVIRWTWWNLEHPRSWLAKLTALLG